MEGGRNEGEREWGEDGMDGGKEEIKERKKEKKEGGLGDTL